MKAIRLTAIVLVLCFIAAACGTPATQSPEAEDTYYVYDEMYNTTLILKSIIDYSLWDTKAYILGQGESGRKIVIYDMQSDTYYCELAEFEDVGDATTIAAYSGGVWLLTKDELISLDLGGIETGRIIAGKDIVDIETGPDGLLYAASKTEVYCYDTDGTLKNTIPAPNGYKITSVDRMGDGSVICQSISKYARIADTAMDITSGSMSAVTTTFSESSSSWYRLTPGSEDYYSAYVIIPSQYNSGIPFIGSGTTINTFNTATGESKIILDTAGMTAQGEIIGLVPLDDAFILLLNGPDEATALRIEKSDTTKNILTIARVDESARGITEAIYSFNQNSKEYYLKTKEYDGDDAYYRFYVDILQGNIPDLVSPVENYEILAKKGVFSDLNTLFENDPDIDRGDFSESILNTLLWRDGSLYMISPSYRLMSVWVEKEYCPYDSWSYKEALQYLEENPDYTIFRGVTPWDMLRYTLITDSGQFVDMETMTCSFTSEEFYTYLKFIKLLAQRNNDEEERMTIGQYFVLTHIGDYASLVPGQYPEYVKLIGAPSYEGSGTFIEPYMFYSICAGSGNEDDAWQFIKYLLSVEYQNQTEYLPISLSALERQADEARGGREEELIIGYSESAILGVTSGELAEEDAPTTTYYIPGAEGMPQSQIDEVYALIASVDKADVSFYNTMLIEIIYEEFVYFYNDDKSVEEVAKLIQNRVQLYLDENK